jgi:parkin coregulated gene protein
MTSLRKKKSLTSDEKKSPLNLQLGKGGFSSSLAKPKVEKKKPATFKRKGITVQEKVKKSVMFRRYYDRGDLPLQVAFDGAHRKVQWKADFDKLDYHHYLPIFFDGVRDETEPFKFLARQGTYDLIAKGGDRLLPVVPQLIMPIKKALNTLDREIVCEMLKILQTLVLADNMIGEALVPYYRQILPVFRLLENKNVNIGDQIDYGQRKGQCLGDLIHETLAVFERFGGEDAFINIKYIIPTYQSSVIN